MGGIHVTLFVLVRNGWPHADRLVHAPAVGKSPEHGVECNRQTLHRPSVAFQDSNALVAHEPIKFILKININIVDAAKVIGAPPHADGLVGWAAKEQVASRRQTQDRETVAAKHRHILHMVHCAFVIRLPHGDGAVAQACVKDARARSNSWYTIRNRDIGKVSFGKLWEAKNQRMSWS